ncbi:MAG: hypothetical protein KGL98_06305, partial [Gammaproteobacteria bacterium]|nr:hypothetical protein [Gammaproteobacteria bacterium]
PFKVYNYARWRKPAAAGLRRHPSVNHYGDTSMRTPNRQHPTFCRFALMLVAIAALTLVISLPTAAQNVPEHSQPVLVEFDAPGATTTVAPACSPFCGTDPYANNDWGEVTGYYTDASTTAHGFVRYPGGDLVSFDAPGAGSVPNAFQGTFASSINNFGAIAGYSQDSNNVFHGFIRSLFGVIITFDAPGAGNGAFQGTIVTCINPQGTTAGFYIDSNSVAHGFVRSRSGVITNFDPSTSISTFTTVTPATGSCLNTAGQITGFYVDASQVGHSFLRDPQGNITSFDGPGALYTEAISINAAGKIIGFFEDSSGLGHGFVRHPDGQFTTFDGPVSGGGNTIPSSINNNSSISGWQFDANAVAHGFVRGRNGQFVAIDAPGAGTGPVDGTFPTMINASGAVTGIWADNNSLAHGFVWYPW